MFPLQIRVLLDSPAFFPFGKFSPYFADFLFLNDLFLMSSLVLWGVHQLFQPSKPLNFGRPGFLAILFILVLISEINLLLFPGTSWIIFFRLFGLVGLYLLILNQILSFSSILKFLVIGLLIPAILSPIQFFLQHSIGLSWLGEPQFDATMTGVAKIDLPTGKLVRSYGTLAHPNLLGGLLSFGLVLGFYLLQKTKQKRYFGVLFILLGGLIFSFSRSAILALSLSFIVYYLVQKRTVSLLLRRFSLKLIFIILAGLILIGTIFPVSYQIIASRFPNFQQTEIQNRLTQYQNSLQIIWQNPLGTGPGHSLPYYQDISETKIAPWDYQPVHNLWLLITAELGIPGLIISLTLIYFIYRQLQCQRRKLISPQLRQINHFNLALIFLIFGLTLFDHYLLTLYQGQILLVFGLSFFGLSTSADPTVQKLS